MVQRRDTQRRKNAIRVGFPSVGNPTRGTAYIGSGVKDLLKMFGSNRAVFNSRTGLRSKNSSKKRKASDITEEGPANSITSTNFGRRKSWIDPTLLKVAAPQKFVINHGQQLTCGVGVQAVWTNTVLGNNTDITTLLGKSPVIPLGAAGVRLFIENVNGQYTFSNQSAATGECTIYDCIARRDLGAAAIQDPWGAWLQGSTDETTASELTTVGATPFHVEAFTKYWKVIKKTPLNIAPGGVHRHRISFSPNKLVSGAEVTYSTYGLQGLTIASMIVWHGQPAHDSTTKTQVSTAAINMDMVSEFEYTFRFPMDNGLRVTKTNNLVAAFTVGQEEFNEDLGELQNAAGLAAGILTA